MNLSGEKILINGDAREDHPTNLCLYDLLAWSLQANRMNVCWEAQEYNRGESGNVLLYQKK